MKPTHVLMEEHEVILFVLQAMEKACAADAYSSVRPGFFIDAADFAKGFADGCHHAKEEGVLFPALEAAGIPSRGGPIAVMLSEHEQGRKFIRQMREAAEKWHSGDPQASQAVLDNANGYIQLLRAHIQKENNILFPMADRAVPEAKQKAVLEEFERIEREETGAGVHQRFEALAEKLQHEASALH